MGRVLSRLGEFLYNCRLTPKRYKRHPLGTMMMFAWTFMGLSLLVEDAESHPWPYLFWPTDLRLGEADDLIGYWAIAVAMILSGVGFLFGHAMRGRKYADLIRWISLWMAVGVAFWMFLGVLLARYVEHYPMEPFWPLSAAIWAIAVTGFGWALNVAKRESFGDACAQHGCDCLSEVSHG